jgi:hypothetical protein
MAGGTCVECGNIADPMGYHNVTCKGTCNANHDRHQTVVRAYNSNTVYIPFFHYDH